MHFFRTLHSRKALKRVFLGLALLGSAAAFAADNVREPVNINQADAQALAANLKGIGLRRAEAIVAYREQHGPFRDAYELTAIKGVGEAIVAANETRIQLSD